MKVKTVFLYRLVAGLCLAASTVALAAPPAASGPQRYIILLQPGETTARVAAAHGLVPDAVYTAALNGFAAVVPPERVLAVFGDRRISHIEPDITVSLIPPVGAAQVQSQNVTISGEVLPTGITRIRADQNPRTDVSAVGVAVIDTGICLTHPDLNVAGSVSFVKGARSGNDDNGHGSHVSGTIGAKRNGAGVVGVAPNVRLYAVKVLDKNGSGSLSQVLSGIDWVTKNAASKQIKVANMSLGFQGTSSSLNSAIHNSVAAGVTYVVAAGNSAMDASSFSPANSPDVITVSAIADSDGTCGATGGATSYGTDDSFATFSNYGAAVEIAAPGVNIYSTYKNGGYATLSGTSMAAPHVTGAAAQFVAANPAALPADVEMGLLTRATPQAPVSCWLDGTSYRGGFSGDPSAEPLVDATGP